VIVRVRTLSAVWPMCLSAAAAAAASSGMCSNYVCHIRNTPLSESAAVCATCCLLAPVTQMPLWRLRTVMSCRNYKQSCFSPFIASANHLIASCVARRCFHGGRGHRCAAGAASSGCFTPYRAASVAAANLLMPHSCFVSYNNVYAKWLTMLLALLLLFRLTPVLCCCCCCRCFYGG
jgi:hypothetical protein